ncbi:hypothetical protein GOB94_14140 [Granulicella sp. 5B5]|uniref:hypothetical protein n=1 Tax=Granulicella sp. 5B5 TaxID=1617967 RepID=UPI0015F383B3|nr:hypothetical protein [Granulicella sp. 5B5]QMV19705.1 hypothetical protein GOB94_14140 [Granulicella sp. 5B5]
MLSDWTAECSADAPTLIVPWSDAESGAHFVDLRAEPYDIAEISEAERHPALGRALRSLNATRSPFLTAKCDAWSLNSQADAEALEALRLELLIDESDVACGFASYIDLLWRERSVFASAHQQQDRLDRIMRRAQKLSHEEAALECVLRPALLDLNGPLEGFSVTLYVTAVGPEPEIAHRRWELALDDIVALLRSKELEPQRGSATIDAAEAYPPRTRQPGER